ncbi:MAG TPA: MFS transporter [Sandaracinaceae bacterium LLY-WYZ-13_1]|nr:MFS transporter [Sandaracinaceae bacterium LLY-WYZ-13_1]
MRWLEPDVPFDPRRVPFFYGWVVVVVSTVGVLMSIPGQTMGVSVFTDPLLGATGLSRLSLSNAYLAGTLTSGLLLPRGGRILDRFGARATALGAVAGLAATLAVLSSVDRIAAAVGGLLPAMAAGVVTWATLALGFTALRFSGQGMLTMVSRTMLGKWFERRRGLTSAISGVFVAFGFASAPLVLDAWIEAAGWRGAWRGMAVAVALGMGAVGWLFFRDNPEACGLRMDGRSPVDGEDDGPPEPSSTRAEALSTPAFWSVALALAVQGMVITGFTFHVVAIGAEAGLDRDDAVAVFLPIAVCSTITGTIVGWAADRTRIRSLVFVMLAAELVGYGGATQLAHPVGYALAVLGVGVAGGFFGPLASVALPRFFGRLHLGAIAGVQTMLLVIGSALGPSALAASEALTGSFRPGLFGCLALPLLVLGVTWVSDHPRDRPPVR